ncbi:ATP-binding cassette domain-containing protein [Paenibacillus daejeonensis]|uniref:ATP-binding cassette domain-containing protein n=1 Tax=Paenibacillus daejeonensis TaxID=135193 RepID=UPI00037CD8F1|nr:ABC transporter ATP-binding protein [Paenibacillus daejeonensis]
MNNQALVTLTEVTKQYGDRKVLTDITITMNHGDCFIIRGSNGSGKSTLLRIVSGLIPFTSGQRILGHPNIVIGYTPDRLPPLRMTSTEYLIHMGRISNVPRKALRERIIELHGMFNLEQHASLKMIHFSKGMLQKVNLMQATLNMPDLLILDEPFSGLDKESTEHLLHSLQQIKASGTAILAAVHEPLLASQLQSQTYWLRQGILVSERGESLLKDSMYSYEIVCHMKQETLDRLTSLFKDMTWQRVSGGSIRFTLSERDYRDFLMECLQSGGEIISLQRKESRS